MATTTANQQPNSDKSGQTKRLLVIVAIAILAAGAAAGGMWFFMQGRAASAPAGAAAAMAAPAPAPVYFALEPMTVNLQADDGETHYLRIGLTLKLPNQATQDLLQEHTPEIRSRVLLALSNKHPADLSTLDGKRALATELEVLIGQPTEPRGMPLRVDDVLFTEFVVQ
ncbi:flagellar basal body-associated protein FliL [Paraburkholderia adhaesiva]|uniref:flagellar basal body-associated protein FliL n=1 Tax=Paraburkholderia adhaesiva TaxID=2883244 RepID=UPI001F358604|nr:flagellar basal body-associated protein FliL [Paraburkholderia adhaesiva]